MSNKNTPGPTKPASALAPVPKPPVVRRPEKTASAVSTVLKPVTSVEFITRACQADKPLLAGDPRWQDLAPGRGDRTVQKLRRRFEEKPPEQFLHAVLASHRGAGKSTELWRLQDALRPRYVSLYLEANVHMDAHQIDVEDLLLVLAEGIERYCREELGQPLPAELLGDVSSWFSQVIKTTSFGTNLSVDAAAGMTVEAGLPFFAKLIGSIKSLFQVESKHREEVRSELKRFPGTLLASVNRLCDAAAEILRPEGKELLILIDNLDRYAPSVADTLLVQHGDRIRQLHCNLLLTPPIALLCRPPTEQIDKAFPCEVMNTVVIRQSNEPYDALSGPGKDLLLAALGKRVDLGRLIPDPRAQNRLITACGGAIRELLALVNEAALNRESDTLTPADIEYAIRLEKQRLRDQINVGGWWDTLAAIARDKQLVSGEACMQVLYHRYVLKYNGNGWYDVLPIITELPEFQRAQRRLAAAP